MAKKKSEEQVEVESNQSPKVIPHKRIQTAEGWKKSQIKMRRSSSKSAGKS